MGDEIDRAQANDEFFRELALRNLHPPRPPFHKGGSQNGACEGTVDPPLRKGGVSEANGGICLDCGEPIPEARRRAVPEATRCVACQTELEQIHTHWRAL